jgi:hypothetical protein
MKKTFDTSFGKVKVSFAMIDTNGTDLCEGVDFNLDGKFIGDAVGLTLDEINKDNIEELLEQYCDL